MQPAVGMRYVSIRIKFVRCFFVATLYFGGTSTWAAGLPGSLPYATLPHPSIPSGSMLLPQRAPSATERHRPANPYAGMSCMQLYVLAMESQNEAEQREFSKKNCTAL